MMIRSVILFFTTLVASVAFATGPALTYHGRILKPDGSPLTASSVQFKIQVRSPGSENCLMYEETQTKNMSASDGAFSIGINDGTGARTDGRSLLVYFNDGSFSGWESIPQQAINLVPQAIDTLQVAGFPASSLVRVADGTGPQSASVLTPANFTELLALINGTSAQYMKSSSTDGTQIPAVSSAPTSPNAGQMWYDTSSHSVKYYNGTTTVDLSSGGGGSGSVTSVGLSLPSIFSVTNSPVTSSGTLTATLASQATNTFLAAPNGSAGTPAFRTIATADLPVIAISGGGTGATTASGARSNLGVAGSGANTDITSITNSTGSISIAPTGALNLNPTTGVISSAVYESPLASAAAPAYTNSTSLDTGMYFPSSTSLGFSTSGLDRIRITSTGYIGIGTTNPVGMFEVRGGTAAASTDGAAIYVVAQNAGSGGNNAGGSIYLTAGNANGSSSGATAGNISIAAGSNVSTTGGGGNVIINGGAAIPGNKPGGVTITAGTANGSSGGNIAITASSAGGNNTGGTLTLQSGGTANGTGGALTLNGGNGGFSGNGSTINLNAGNGGSSSGNAGSINLTTGTPSNGNGGSVSITASNGVGTNRNGGNLTLTAGTATGTGTAGVLRLMGGNVGVGVTSPSALLHLNGGGSAAGTAPLKFTSGSKLSSAEDGAMEYDGSNYYLTVGSNRYAIPLSGGTGSFANISTNSGSANSPSISFSADTNTGIYSAGTGVMGLSAGGTDVLKLNTATSAVNYLSMTAAATGAGPTLTATGSDTNVDLNLSTKGTGIMNLSAAKVFLPGSSECMAIGFPYVSATGCYGNTVSVAGYSNAGSIGSGRASSSTVNGYALTITAGSPKTSAVDKNGGDLNLSGGAATGAGTSNINFLTTSAGTAGSGDNAATAKMILTGAGNLGVGTTSPQTKLEVSGALRLSSSTVDMFSTPRGTNVGTKINIPIYDPGSYGQNIAMGLPSTADSTSRVMSLFDARTGSHQPTLTVFSPDENQVLGFSFEGSDSVGYVKSSVDLGFKLGTAEDMRIVSSTGYVGIGTTNPANRLSVNGVIESMTGGIRFPDGTIQTTAAAGGSGGTMLNQWPDAVRCTNGSQYWHLVLANGPWGDGRYYYSGAGEWIGFNADGSYYSSSSTLSSYDCVTAAQSISTLYSLGRAYNFVGGGSNLWTASGSDTFFGGGNVGIGTTSPAQKLQVGMSGDGTVALANAWTTFSDARLKNIQGKIPNACQIIDKLNGYYYTWKSGADQSRQVGVIAQEVEAVLPELVKETPQGVKTVDYSKLTAVLIEANKELHRTMKTQTREIASVKAENAELKKINERHEKTLANLEQRLRQIEKTQKR